MKYGYYCRPTDIKKVVHPLIAMLDGSTDVPHTSEGMQLYNCMIYCSVWWVKVDYEFHRHLSLFFIIKFVPLTIYLCY